LKFADRHGSRAERDGLEHITTANDAAVEDDLGAVARCIDFDQLRTTSNQPEADPFDLLCHLAFNAPLRTRRERADRLKKEERSFFEKYGPEACDTRRSVGNYAEHGTAQFVIPDVLKVPPISERSNVIEIAKLFGGPEKLRAPARSCRPYFTPRRVRSKSLQ
jgi:hypothetical protein